MKFEVSSKYGSSEFIHPGWNQFMQISHIIPSGPTGTLQWSQVGSVV